MKFAVKIILVDGTETMCALVHADNTESVQTWDNAGHAEAHALKVREQSPRGTRTSVIVWDK